MVVNRGALPLAVGLAALTFALSGCGMGGDDEPAEEAGRAPAEEAATRSRERVQAYLDAMVAKDVAAGRSQFCATAHAAFDAAATSPNGDFAEHFTVPAATVTDVRPGARGQEVSASVTVSVGGQSTTRALLFTVTRTGADWCIADEVPGEAPPSGVPATSTVEPSPSSAP
ncbi:hypothetical protein ACIBCR_31395 [Micromonospora echinospora]|uniref:hypothetical protein n=1 Tax=Micromonospora echinospora TaxID=1877 RepID=UPI0037B7211F